MQVTLSPHYKGHSNLAYLVLTLILAEILTTLHSLIIVPLVIKVPQPKISNSINSTGGNNSTAT